VIASHSNALALLKGWENNRHLPDEVIRGLLERDGVLGVVALNSFLQTGWKRGDDRNLVPLNTVVTHIDYICQMAGDARHVGLGTDFDGGFGWQAVPAEIDSIADLQKISPLLRERGYTEDDIALILAGNTARLLAHIFKETE
jgi:membrane dipeptidase